MLGFAQLSGSTRIFSLDTTDKTQRPTRVDSARVDPGEEGNMTRTRLHTPIEVFAPGLAAQRSALHSLTSPPASLSPYLSSPETGWGGLVAKAVHEVREMEGWRLPAHTGVSLTLFSGGPLRLAWREVHAHQSWTELVVRSGDLILLVGHQPYEMRWRSLSRAPTHSFNLRMPREALTQTAERVAGCDPAHLTLLERAGFQDPLLLQLALAVWRELQEGAPTGALFAQDAAQLIAHQLLRRCMADSDRITATPSPASASSASSAHRLSARQLQRVIACIEDQPAQELTLDVLAAQTGFSRHHFAYLFRQTTGETPHRFVLRRHLERARRLLEAGELPLAHIAVACGFADQSSFTRAFKRLLGLTPRAYQREWAISAPSPRVMHNIARNDETMARVPL
jgi:AraC family transcriptional regulator